MSAGSVVRVIGLQKNYSGLRPLRIQALEIAAGERVALGGLDAAATEVLVNLITGAGVPDAGHIEAFGRATSDISNGDEWLSSLDRFGIVSPRAVILEGSTLLQNLALPFTLQIDPVPEAVVAQASALATECGMAVADLPRPAGELPPHVRVRAHLARAIALRPELLIIEHPTVDVAEGERLLLAHDIARVAGARGAATLIMTTDVEFAEVVAHRSLALQPATGALVPWKKKRGWFR
jgi:ABC-type transporter Mla maintaining outer membrane lipid asymmetry ATPase subunit MlaF